MSGIKEEKSVDVIILGGGPAGISAAIWCAELGMTATVIEPEPALGGQLHRIFLPIRNYPGISEISATEMLSTLTQQAKNSCADILLNSTPIKIDLDKKEVTLDNGEVSAAKAMVIATGVRRRKLEVPGEKEFASRGILISGAKQAKETRGARVAIVGGGDAAIENSLILSEYAEQVYVLHRRKTFTARPEFFLKASLSPKIELITDVNVTGFTGGEKLSGISYEHITTGEIEHLNIDNVLIRIGNLPNTELFAGQLSLDKSGSVKIDEHCRTSSADIYAIGDVTAVNSPSLSAASGHAAIAALSIQRSLKD